ncbi:MAG: MerR family transcriptional regulator, light-induced transcriptional regulator, partial [Solirubrobacteraceae bacterium]|nr:MerR family transcriptional regulator, light-induced transcriptional regulator [Solirubrobacteraceae bacterium]
VVASYAPDAVVIAGHRLPDDDIALWAYRVRSTAGPLPVTLFRSSHRSAPVRTTGTRVLSHAPFHAHRQVLAFIDDRRPGSVREIAPVVVPVADRKRREAQA